jgi:hypothetical protein
MCVTWAEFWGFKSPSHCRAVVVHAFNHSIWEAEASGYLSSRTAWSTEWVPGQPGLHRETLSWKTKKKKSPTPPPGVGWVCVCVCVCVYVCVMDFVSACKLSAAALATWTPVCFIVFYYDGHGTLWAVSTPPPLN